LGHHASAAAQSTDAERETARSAMDQGDRLRAVGDLQGALARYKAAHELMRVPTTGIELARTQAELSLLVEARSSAIETAHLPKTAAEPAVFESARRAAAKLAADLEPRIPSVLTSVSPALATYTLIIDDLQLPAAARSLPFRTNPGAHVVVVKASGYRSVVEHFALVEAEHRTLHIELKAAREPKATPLKQAQVELVPAASSATPASDDGSRGARFRGYLALSVGVAVLGAGVVSGLISWVKTSDLERQCHAGVCPDSAASGLRSANGFANVANVAVPLGLVAIGYSVYSLIDAHARQRPAAAAASHLQLRASATGAYASWSGTL
jgi:hypothetical protein